GSPQRRLPVARASRPLALCVLIAALVLASPWLLRRAQLAPLPEVLGAGGEALASSSADLENSAEPARSPAAAADLGPARVAHRRILRGTVTSVCGAPV